MKILYLLRMEKHKLTDSLQKYVHVHYEEKGDEKCQDIEDIRVMSSTNKMRFYGITQSATCHKGLHQQTIGVFLERKILLWIQHKTDSYSIMGCCI